jgi:hypothetical protein
MAAAPSLGLLGQPGPVVTPLPALASTNLCAAAGAANSTAAVTLDAETSPSRPHVISQILWSYSGAPTGGRLTVQNHTDIVVDLDITASGPDGVRFDPPLLMAAGTTATVRLHPAAGVTGKVNVVAFVIT